MGRSRPIPVAHTWFAIGLLYCGHRHRDLSALRRGAADHPCIEDPAVIKKILTHIDSKDAPAEPARSPPCRAPRQPRWF